MEQQREEDMRDDEDELPIEQIQQSSQRLQSAKARNLTED